MSIRKALTCACLSCLALVCLPAAAHAAALVDDPASAAAIPPATRSYFAEREAEYQSWLAGQGARSVRPARMVVDAPYRVLSTTSHKQLRNDFCVPATTTIIDHFLRGATVHWSQWEWAKYRYGGVPLWTDAAGGNMWVMAMGLKSVTGRGYAYSTGNTATSVYNRTEYGIYQKSRPVGYGLRIIASNWPNYQVNHTGHIVCGRGFDWRYGLIHVDDPYPEDAPAPLGYGSDGGDTYGKKTYKKAVVAGGVVASASQQVVY